MTPDFHTEQIMRCYYNRVGESPTDDYIMVAIVEIEYRLKGKGYIVLSLDGKSFWVSARQLEAE